MAEPGSERLKFSAEVDLRASIRSRRTWKSNPSRFSRQVPLPRIAEDSTSRRFVGSIRRRGANFWCEYNVVASDEIAIESRGGTAFWVRPGVRLERSLPKHAKRQRSELSPIPLRKGIANRRGVGGVRWFSMGRAPARVQRMPDGSRLIALPSFSPFFAPHFFCLPASIFSSASFAFHASDAICLPMQASFSERWFESSHCHVREDVAFTKTRFAPAPPYGALARIPCQTPDLRASFGPRTACRSFKNSWRHAPLT